MCHLLSNGHLALDAAVLDDGDSNVCLNAPVARPQGKPENIFVKGENRTGLQVVGVVGAMQRWSLASPSLLMLVHGPKHACSARLTHVAQGQVR
jgi:hypothetical protein